VGYRQDRRGHELYARRQRVRRHHERQRLYLDTGVDAAHTDLNVVNQVNFAGGPDTDCHGHGTHVAGTVAAKDNAQDVVGVAPGAPITGVKVLRCSGSGRGRVSSRDRWVTAQAAKPAVANMSLAGGAIQAVDDAVTRRLTAACSTPSPPETKVTMPAEITGPCWHTRRRSHRCRHR
jgi:hypothetical protein